MVNKEHFLFFSSRKNHLSMHTRHLSEMLKEQTMQSKLLGRQSLLLIDFFRWPSRIKSFTSTNVKLRKLHNPYLTLLRRFKTSPEMHLTFTWNQPIQILSLLVNLTCSWKGIDQNLRDYPELDKKEKNIFKENFQDMRQEREIRKLSLTDLLAKPFQRIPRYRLLLKVSHSENWKSVLSL